MKNQLQTQEQVKNIAQSIQGDCSEQLASLKQLIAHGNLKSLDDSGRLKYYAAVCQAIGLNPLTQPFEFIELKGKLKMYPTKECAEQLRKINGVSCEKVEHKIENGLYYVIATVKDKTGRIDTSAGVIPVGNKQGEDLANLIMKTETKAKRRATLSICGLGFLLDTDEDEVREKQVQTPEPVKLEDYQIQKEIQTEELATEEQISAIEALYEQLQKKPGYMEALLKSRFGHEDITKVSRKFMEGWINKLQAQVDENQNQGAV